MAIIQWFGANWQSIVVALLAIDAALLPIFPNVTLLPKLKGWLLPLAPQK